MFLCEACHANCDCFGGDLLKLGMGSRGPCEGCRHSHLCCDCHSYARVASCPGPDQN